MLRVYRDPSGEWWIDRVGVGVDPPRLRQGPPRVNHIDELEEEVADRLSKLLFADNGSVIDNVGKRISDEVFWLFFEEEDDDD